MQIHLLMKLCAKSKCGEKRHSSLGAGDRGLARSDQIIYTPINSWYIDDMKTAPVPKLDKSAFAVAALTAPSGEAEYWLTKSPAERLAAVETMRQIIYGYHPLTTRLQRVFEVTQRA